MARFTSDYVMCCHPEVMRALAEDNGRLYGSYGEDERSAAAAEMVRGLCAAPKAAVHLVPGGTMANMLVCCAAMRPHHTVLAADTGHISLHETGAIEATGHKVSCLPATAGKITAKQVREHVQAHNASPDYEHIVKPRLVYISFPTEYGTLYSAAELREMRAVCDEFGLLLYADGARMGYGLVAPGNDVDLPLLAECCDAFTIGGNKVGAAFGEAIILTSPVLAEDFRFFMKQRGAMMSKGWLLGLQYEVLLAGGTDSLYFKGARHAIAMAQALAKGLGAQGATFQAPPVTNQIFVVMRHGDIARLREKHLFEDWETIDDEVMVVRFCTSWSTKPEEIEQLVADFGAL